MCVAIGAIIAVLTTPWTAQSVPTARRAQRVPPGSAVRDAGIYHVATGNWTRAAVGHAALGLDTVYSNDSPTGYFSGLLDGDVVIDEGELPGVDHPLHGPGTDRQSYVVNGFTFGYCADFPKALGVFRLGFYERYTPCGDPSTLGLVDEKSFEYAGILPGAPSSFDCWIVTIDLGGTSDRFLLEASGEGTHDGAPDLDSFGWRLEIDGGGTGGFESGPLVAGDPNYYAFGGGCYYTQQGPIPCTNQGTGLGSADGFFGQGPGFPPTSTCYFFGGYKNTIGPNQPSHPYGSFWLCVYADDFDEHEFLRHCTAEASTSASTGLTARLELETQDSNGALVGFERSIAANSAPNRLQMILRDAPGPANGGVTNIGYFLMGTGLNTFTPPGSAGSICVAPGIKRFLPPVNRTNETIVFHDPGTGSPTTASGIGFSRTALGTGAHASGAFLLPGSRWGFQAWFRDGAHPSNLSDAISIDFSP